MIKCIGAAASEVRSRTPVRAGDLKSVADKLATGIDKFLNKVGNWISSDDQTKLKYAKSGDKFIFEFTVNVEGSDLQVDGNLDRTVRMLLKCSGHSDDYKVFDLAIKWQGDDDSKAEIAKGIKIPAMLSGPENSDSNEGAEQSGDSYDSEITNEISEKQYCAYLFSIIEPELHALIEKLTDGFTDSYDEEPHLVNASTNLLVSFQKITSSEETSVELTSVYSTYSACDTLDAITALASNDNFVADLPEGSPTSYSVVINDDGYDVEPCEHSLDDTLYCAIDRIIKSLYRYVLTLKYIRHNLVTNRFDFNDWAAGSQIDDLMNLQTRLYDTVSDPIKLIKDIEPVDYDTYFNYEASLKTLHMLIYNICCEYDTFYCNFPTEFQQSMLSNWLLEWKNNLYYAERLMRPE